MPLIISVPHGGTLKPADIPDRKDGEFVSDAHTEELARAVQQVIHNCFGHWPHVVICRLERRKSRGRGRLFACRSKVDRPVALCPRGRATDAAAG